MYARVIAFSGADSGKREAAEEMVRGTVLPILRAPASERYTAAARSPMRAAAVPERSPGERREESGKAIRLYRTDAWPPKIVRRYSSTTFSGAQNAQASSTSSRISSASIAASRTCTQW